MYFGMMKKILLALGVALVVTGGVRAETGTTTGKSPEEIEEYKEMLRATKAPLIEAEKARMREQKLPIRVENKEDRLKMKEDLKTRIEQRREEFKDKLEEMRDVRKKAILERVNDRICRINSTRTAAMTRHLTTMTNILNRVEERAASAEARGKDVSSVDAAVATARSAIATAQAAVVAQEERPCDLAISGDETTVGSEVSAARQALKSQLESVHLLVKAARQATGDAIRALARILGEPIPKEITE